MFINESPKYSIIILSILSVLMFSSCDVMRTIFGGLDDLGNTVTSLIPDAPENDEAD